MRQSHWLLHTLTAAQSRCISSTVSVGAQARFRVPAHLQAGQVPPRLRVTQHSGRRPMSVLPSSIFLLCAAPQKFLRENQRGDVSAVSLTLLFKAPRAACDAATVQAQRPLASLKHKRGAVCGEAPCCYVC